MKGLSEPAAQSGSALYSLVSYDVGWLLVPLAVAWTLVIAGYLAWTFLTRHDEERLLEELDAAYGAPPEPTPD